MAATNWNDPQARAKRMEKIGRAQYMRELEAHFDATTVTVENGYRIRSIKTRWGIGYIVDGLGRGDYSLEGALKLAREAPKRGTPETDPNGQTSSNVAAQQPPRR